MLENIKLVTPDFIILGAQKCGTTSLFSYLGFHPEIKLPKSKELHFFDHKYQNGIDWYRNCFPRKSDENEFVTGEASPYYLFHPLVAQRISLYSQDIKFIVLLRDPVDRAYSHFMMEKSRGNETLQTFEEALEKEEQRLAEGSKQLFTELNNFSFDYQMYSYKARGKYSVQLAVYFSLFNRSQFLFLKSESFFKDPKANMLMVYDFLNIKKILPEVMVPEFVNSYPPMLRQTRERLRNYYKDESIALEKLLGSEFTWCD